MIAAAGSTATGTIKARPIRCKYPRTLTLLTSSENYRNDLSEKSLTTHYKLIANFTTLIFGAMRFAYYTLQTFCRAQ